jgi:protein NrfD
MNPFVHDPGWGWWIIGYFYLGGLAAGCYFLATLIELFGHDEDRPLARIGYRVAFPLVCVCAVLLIVDLERPERFWHMMLQSEVVDRALKEGSPLDSLETMLEAVMLKWWSPMSIGAQALGIFGLCTLISFWGSFRRIEQASGLPESKPGWKLTRRWIGRSFKVLGSVVGFFVAGYTGVLLTATNQPLWSGTDWIGPLFLTSAASTGIALLLLLGGRVPAETRERLERADLWALALELFIFLLFLASLGGVLPLALATWEGLVLVVGTLVVGLLVPLWLHLGLRTPSHGRVTVAALCALAGGFLLRFGIVQVAPALLHQYPTITPADIDSPLWHSWVGKALLGATVLLGLLIPYVLARRWQFSKTQTALAGAVSLLLLAAVTLHAFSPASAHPVLDPLPGMSLSPEYGRERGGGVGASGSNRPAQPFLRGKLSGNR